MEFKLGFTSHQNIGLQGCLRECYQKRSLLIFKLLLLSTAFHKSM